MNLNERYLGIDFGLQRVGIAISYGSLAEPLEILRNDTQLFAQIKRFCQEFRITGIVLGISEQKMAEKTQVWGQELGEYLDLPIYYSDEVLSSREVSQKLRETRKGKKQFTGHIDHFAATLILQRFLDENE